MNHSIIVLFTALVGIITMMVLWAFVQHLWVDSFSDYTDNPDALAHRTNCGNCGCTTLCYKNESSISDNLNSTTL